MTIRDLLSRLGDIRQTGQRQWKACCPAHADVKPSLGVSLTDEGKILVHCYAGCAATAVVEALGLSLADLQEGEDAAFHSTGVTAAVDLPPVAEWLRVNRGISEVEVARMHARETKRGLAVAFPYEDTTGRTRYTKYRLTTEKAFWRCPTGVPSLLYGLPDLIASSSARAIVTEGELDAHALRAAGFAPVVSLPDGSGSRMTPELLAPLARFAEIIIATDADDAGERAAFALVLALGAHRCRRVRFAGADGKAFKDAGDALKAGWTHVEFSSAIEAAEPFADSEPANDNARREITVPYRVIDGVFCYVRTDRQKNESVQSLANFSASIEEQITRDDGNENSTYFKIAGRLANGEPLAPIQVASTEYPGLGWVSKWGHGPTVYAGSGKRDHVRVAIDLLSKPTRHCIYAHTGWRQIDGKWVYLFHGGAVGAADVSVALDPPLDRAVLPADSSDPVEALRWSLGLLSCGPLDVTVPLLGAIYAAPLSFILNPDCTVWLVGSTGSYKSELATLAQRHFGNFERTSLPVSWSGTEAAIEYKLSVMKDMVCVVDDFAPQPDIRSQQDQAKRAEHIIRNVGNRASRDRMRADLTQRPSRPPRGLLISTGEDLPSSPSIQARLIPVQVDKDRVDVLQLTALQRHGRLFPVAMRAFIDDLRPQIDSLRESLPELLARAREHFTGGGGHARQPSGLALLYVGLDLALQFAVKIGAIDRDERRRLSVEGRDALMRLGARQARDLEEIDPAQRYIEVLREELAQGRAVLCERPSTEPRGSNEAEVIGYRDDDYAYLLPEAARKRVSCALRAAGEAWSVTAKTLHVSLVKKKIVIPGSEGRPQTKRSFGGTRVRVLTVPLAVLWDRPPAPVSPAPGAAPANESGAAGAGQTSWLNKGFDAAAPHAPPAPLGEGRWAAVEED